MGPPQVPLTQLAPTVIGVMWMETLLATVFVSLRVYTRYFISQAGVGWDDAFMVASLLLFVAYSATCSAATLWGFGHHMDELTIPQFSKANLLEVIGQTTLISAIATSKTSVALFLLRIVVKTWHQIVLWTAIATLAIICFLCASLNFLQCKPYAHLWNPTIEAKCWMNITPLAIATGAYSVLIDFLLAGLPWAIVWTLNMRKKEKLNIAIALSLGVFAGMCGIIRTYELHGLSAQSDYSYETVSLVIWSASELLITIICANIPMLRPLWAKLRGTRVTDGAASPGPSRSLGGHNNATIGGTSSRGQKRSRDLRGMAWNELDDVSVSTTTQGYDGIEGLGSTLGGPKQGKNRTVVKGSYVDRDDDARSSESILRENRMGPGSGAARGMEVTVSKQYEVTGGSHGGEPGQAW